MFSQSQFSATKSVAPLDLESLTLPEVQELPQFAIDAEENWTNFA